LVSLSAAIILRITQYLNLCRNFCTNITLTFVESQVLSKRILYVFKRKKFSSEAISVVCEGPKAAFSFRRAHYRFRFEGRRIQYSTRLIVFMTFNKVWVTYRCAFSPERVATCTGSLVKCGGHEVAWRAGAVLPLFINLFFVTDALRTRDVGLSRHGPCRTRLGRPQSRDGTISQAPLGRDHSSISTALSPPPIAFRPRRLSWTILKLVSL